MLQTLVEYLLNTPWWVYLIFIYLLFIGINAIKPRTVSFTKLFIIPGIFCVWGVSGILEVAGFSLTHFLWWLLGVSMVGCLGYLRTFKLPIAINYKTKSVLLPGSYVTLSVVLIIFISKYTFAALLSQNPSLVHNMAYITSNLMVSGAVTGWFLGRLFAYLQKYHEGRVLGVCL